MMRILHTVLRVTDLDKALAFYTKVLGMKLLRQKDYPEGRVTPLLRMQQHLALRPAPRHRHDQGRVLKILLHPTTTHNVQRLQLSALGRSDLLEIIDDRVGCSSTI